EGRTVKSLLRLVRDWNPELDGASRRTYSWSASGVAPFRYIEKGVNEPDRDWSIVELLNSAALRGEGRAMQHCVYTYAEKCRRRETTIWSLRLRVNLEEKRLATIEIDPRRCDIIQIKARRNRPPGHHSQQIIRQWASHAGLA